MTVILPDKTCGCLCVMNHRDLMGICAQEASDSVKFVNMKEGIDQPIEVPMCHPCAEATRIRRVKHRE